MSGGKLNVIVVIDLYEIKFHLSDISVNYLVQFSTYIGTYLDNATNREKPNLKTKKLFPFRQNKDLSYR